MTGGYRSGKTDLGANKAIAVCVGKHPTLSERQPPPVYGRYVGTTWEDGVKGVVLKKFQQCVPRADLYGGSWETAWSEKSRTLTFNLHGDIHTKGSIIRFFTGTQHVLTHAGDDIDFCIFDEHIAFPYFQQAIARLIDRNGWFMCTMTADSGITWEDEYIIQKAAEGDMNYQVWRFDSRKNPHLSQDGLNALIEMVGDDKEMFRALIMGEMVALSGRVYPMFDENLHVIDGFEIANTRDWHRQVIADIHGYKPAAILWLAWHKAEGRVFAYREASWQPNEGGVDDLARFIRAHCAGEKIHDWIEDDPYGKGEGDDARNVFGTRSIRDQLRDAGIPFENVSTVSDKQREAGFIKVRQFLQVDGATGLSRLAIFRCCPRLIRQMQTYRYLEQDKMTREREYRELVRKVDDDLVDVLRYGIMAEPPMLRAPAMPVRYDPETGEPLFTQGQKIMGPEEYD